MLMGEFLSLVAKFKDRIGDSTKKEDNETIIKEKVKGEDNETKEKASIRTPTKHTNIRHLSTVVHT